MLSFQNKLIYLNHSPEDARTEVITPTQFGLTYEDVYLTTEDGVRIHAYLILSGRQRHGRSTIKPQQQQHQQQPCPTIILFHGNGGNLGYNLPLVQRILDKLPNCNMFMLSYRGYGHSEGTPDEQGLKLDVSAAIAYIKNHPEINPRSTAIAEPAGTADASSAAPYLSPLIVYGHSLGGAVAIDCVARHPPGTFNGLIVENTFTTMADIIHHLIPITRYLPPFVLTQKWESIEKIKSVRSLKGLPMLFLSGCKDELIPQAMVKKLCEAAKETAAEDDRLATLAQANGSAGANGPSTSAAWSISTKLMTMCSSISRDENDSVINNDASTTARRPDRIWWREFPYGTHNDTYDQPGYVEAIAEFVNTFVPSS